MTEGLESTTRSWATDQVRYDGGQIIGDVGTLVAEYAAFLKAAKVVSGAIKGISGMMFTEEAASSVAVAGASTVAGGVTLESYLAIAAEIFLNFSTFKNDWNTLQEDWKEAEAKEAEETEEERLESDVSVSYNGEKSAIYRGGTDFTIKTGEVKINPETGNVRTTHGISVNVDPKAVSRFGGSYRIDYLPEGLEIVQRGSNPGHFEIVPAYEMPLETFQELLYQIVVSGPY